jgi:bifunctional DNase/RNase
VVPEDAKEKATELVEVRLDGVRHGMVDDRDELWLVEVGGPRILTIWIGPVEADAINSRLRGMTRERPLTHDLMASLLRPFDVDVAKVVVTRLDNQVFLAEVHLRRQGREVVVDARPSDAVSLAVRTAAPIFVAAPVFAAAAALKAHPPDVPPRPDCIHFELVDETGSKLLEGWMAPTAELKAGGHPFEVHGARGQVTTYEILEVQDAGERRIRAVVRLVSRRQRDWDVPN